MFTAKRGLNFFVPTRSEARHITGVNIIDDLLFWTDNYSEPKKINITRCLAGTPNTNLSANIQTKLKVKNEDGDLKNINEIDTYILADNAYSTTSGEWLINSDLQEKHVTVMRQAPKTPPTLEMNNSDRPGEVTDIYISDYSFVSADVSDEQILENGDIKRINKEVFENTNFRKDDILIITYDLTTAFTPVAEDEESNDDDELSYTTDTIRITAKFICYEDEETNEETFSGPTSQIKIKIVNIAGQSPTTNNLNWRVELKQRKPLFETKFVRFGYRYKYEDGEYSSFSPWSEIAFLPGRLEYNTKKGYNLGMENDVRELIVKDFIPYNIPLDVKAVDLLYKATDNANVYVAETFERGKSPEWQLYTPDEESIEISTGRLNIVSEMIVKVLPETQLLRSWDNVPRAALSQEIVGNRVVYGNYYQGYDLPRVGLISEIESLNHISTTTGSKSIKSLRDYRIGMVFGDKYGRETPVITGGYTTGNTTEGSTDIENITISSGMYVDKTLAPKWNRIIVSQNWEDATQAGSNSIEPPSWLKDDGYIKYFIKEPSMEYYNIVLDRWYNTGDNNTIWLSFNSADRNKIDEETHLILKNRHATDEPVLEDAKYKVLAISNETPDFIKRQPRNLGTIRGIGAYNTKGIWRNSYTTGGYNNSQGTPGYYNEFNIPPYGLFSVNSQIDVPDLTYMDSYSCEIRGSNWNSSSIGQWAEMYSYETEDSSGSMGSFGEPFGRPIDPSSLVEFRVIGEQLNECDQQGTVDATVYSEWREISHWSSTDTGVKITWSERFDDTENGGVDMFTIFTQNPNLTVNSGVASDGSSVGDVSFSSCEKLRYSFEFREVQVRNRPEFEGKFFVKVEVNEALSNHILNLSVGEGALWEPIATYNLSYIDSQFTNPTDMDMAYDASTNIQYDSVAYFNVCEDDGDWFFNAFDTPMNGLAYGLDIGGVGNSPCAGYGTGIEETTEAVENYFNWPTVVTTTGFGQGTTPPDWGYVGTESNTNQNIEQLIGAYYGNAALETYGFPYMPFVPLEYIYDENGNQLTAAQVNTAIGDNQDISDFGYISAENSMWGVEGFVDVTPGEWWFGGNDSNQGGNQWSDPVPTGLQFIPGAGTVENPNLYGAGVFGGTCGPWAMGAFNEATALFWMEFYDSVGQTNGPAPVFMDGAGARKYVTNIEYPGYPGLVEGGSHHEYDFFKPQPLQEGQIANADGSFGTADSLGRMNLGILYSHYYGQGYATGSSIPQAVEAGRDFFDTMTTVGTVFKFQNDLSGDVYKVIWVEPKAWQNLGWDNPGSVFTTNVHNNLTDSWNNSGIQITDEVGMASSIIQLNGSGSAEYISNPNNQQPNELYEPLAGTWIDDFSNVGTPGCAPLAVNALPDVGFYGGWRLNRAIEFRKIDPNSGLLLHQTGLRVDVGGSDNGGVFDPRAFVRHDGSNHTSVQILRLGFGFSGGYEKEKPVTDKGAIFETEPRESADVDIYYEGSTSLPIKLSKENTLNYAPAGSDVGFIRHRQSGDDVYFEKLGKVNVGLVYTINAYKDNKRYDRIILSLIKTSTSDSSFGEKSLYTGGGSIGDTIVFKHSGGLETRSKVINHLKPTEDSNTAIVPFGLLSTSEPNETITGSTEKPRAFEESPIQEAQIYTGSFGQQQWPFVSTGTLLPSQCKVESILLTGNSAGTLLEDHEIIVENLYVNNVGYNQPLVATIGGGPQQVYPVTFSDHEIFSPDPLNSITVLAEAVAADEGTANYTGGGLYANGFDFKVRFKEKTGYFEIDTDVWKYPVTLGWHNCFSFRNGLESDRIRDDFNAPTIDNGIKASTTFSGYGEERISSGMIYSGLYNSTSQVNDLNEFNMSQKITKNLNPSYGSIQALKTRNTDMVVLTEDKVLKVLANKDAVYNADGNPQLVATNRVLGTAVPFAGDYGISKDPESLVADQFRMYFTDKQRGAVLRLSQDGLTPISSVGMKTWFRENLRTTYNLIGTYDTVNGEYNLTLKRNNTYGAHKTLSFSEAGKGWVSFKSFIPSKGVSVAGKYYTTNNNKIYEHHIPTYNESGVCVESDVCEDRNTFYGEAEDSSVTVLFNEKPEVVKSFETLSYEGSQAKIDKFVGETNVEYGGIEGETVNVDDFEYYNLIKKDGWYTGSITTDLENATLTEFINKENKWFNSVIGVNYDANTMDTGDFTVQGLGQLISVVDSEMNYSGESNLEGDGSTTGGTTDIDDTDEFIENNEVIIPGCTNSAASNYNTEATTDDGSCVYYGCNDNRVIGENVLTGTGYEYYDENASGNYLTPSFSETAVDGCESGESFTLSNINPDNNLPYMPDCCQYFGCVDPNAINYVGDALAPYFEPCDSSSFYTINNLIASTGSGNQCHECIYDCSGGNIANATCGCNDPAYLDYWLLTQSGMNTSTPIYVLTTPTLNENGDPYDYQDDSCSDLVVYGCTDVEASNHDPMANVDDGSCAYGVFGCTDPLATNYDSSATLDDGSCIYPSAESDIKTGKWQNKMTD